MKTIKAQNEMKKAIESKFGVKNFKDFTVTIGKGVNGYCYGVTIQNLGKKSKKFGHSTKKEWETKKKMEKVVRNIFRNYNK